jgi:glycerol kinase
LAIGFWNNTEDLISNWQINQTWQPQMNIEQRECLYKEWLKAVQRTFDWVGE